MQAANPATTYARCIKVHVYFYRLLTLRYWFGPRMLLLTIKYRRHWYSVLTSQGLVISSALRHAILCRSYHLHVYISLMYSMSYIVCPNKWVTLWNAMFLHRQHC